MNELVSAYKTWKKRKRMRKRGKGKGEDDGGRGQKILPDEMRPKEGGKTTTEAEKTSHRTAPAGGCLGHPAMGEERSGQQSPPQKELPCV